LLLRVEHECWPIAGGFTISRGTKNAADVVVATIELAGLRGRGECVPYGRYDETIENVIATIESQRDWLHGALLDAGRVAAVRDELGLRVRAGAARNALDCALWDLESKLTATPVWSLAGLGEPHSLTTAFTLSLGTPESMAAVACAAAGRPLLKLKLGGTQDVESANGDIARLVAVRRVAPNSRLVVDANEGWNVKDLPRLLSACCDQGVELVEQPLREDDDSALIGMPRDVPLCADESAHDLSCLKDGGLADRYDAINIKLDKTGGLTEALAMARAAQSSGLSVMVGCMVATSLAMAPAMLVAQHAAIVDLDGPLLLSEDREAGLRFEGSEVFPPSSSLWG
jgi:L-alanine-DL-glutamate epimerase-like enolase superfamily enzyme